MRLEMKVWEKKKTHRNCSLLVRIVVPDYGKDIDLM
jgi:hypothetical protein